MAISAIAAIYAVILKLATEVFLGGSDRHNTIIAVLATLVVVLLAPVVKDAIQTTLDRAHYRDRYDYRRALVGFARDLNNELDPARLGRRLVERVRTTLGLDRMALLIVSADGGSWSPLHAEGFAADADLRLTLLSGIGGRRRRWARRVAGRPAVDAAFLAGEKWRAGASAACTTSCRACHPSARLP